MNPRKFRFIIALGLIASFLLTPFMVVNVLGSESPFGSQELVINSGGSFSETFLEQTYKSAATTAWGWGGGQITNMRNFSFISQDFFATPYPIKGIEVQGRKAYLVMDTPVVTDSLQILDITSPAFMIQTSTCSSYQDMISIAINGDVLYVGLNDSYQQINVYNASDPYDLGGVGYYIDDELVDGAVTDIEPRGQFVYFTAFNSTSDKSLRILDASDPDNVKLITNDWASRNAYGLDVFGDLSFIAAGNEGFYVLNTSNKYSATEYDYLPTPGFAADVLVKGPVAYLAAGEAGVHVIDIRDPTNVAILDTFDTDGFARRLKIQGNTLYVSDTEGGLYVLDIADPTHLSYATKLVLGNKVWDMDVFGNYIVFATDLGVYSYMAGSDGGGMMDFGTNAYRSTFSGFDAWDVKVKGDIAYVAAGQDGFYTLDVHDPLNPTLLDHQTEFGVHFRKLDVEGQYAYCVDADGVYIYDISDPANIEFLSFTLGTDLVDIDVEGEIMYVSFGNPAPSGISTANVSNPSIPIIMNNEIFGTNITAIDVQGPHIYSVNYIGAGGPGLHVHDLVPDAGDLTFLASETRSSYFYDIFVDGDYAYCSDTTWLVIENVQDPYNPFFVNDVDWGSAGNFIQSLGVCTFGYYIINAAGSQGAYLLDGIDITPISFPGSNFANATSAMQICAVGDYTYVANRSSLVILRHYESPATTYVPGTFIAQTIELDNMTDGFILSAILEVDDYIPVGTQVNYFLSADGGTHWELVTPGVEHEFLYQGEELLWRAELIGPEDRSVHIYSFEIIYDYNLRPITPVLDDPGVESKTGIAKCSWNASTDDGLIDHYELQVSTLLSFSELTKEYNTTKLNKQVYGLKKGTYYFRVRAVDDEGLPSLWSNVEQIEITGELLGPMMLGIYSGILALVLAGVIILVVLIRRKKKAVTR
ncbi:MAG: hypothetical protein GNW80_13205 [Asgard group archaeon]|nr:hypothetical protein [Asgard group archaeon]